MEKNPDNKYVIFVSDLVFVRRGWLEGADLGGGGGGGRKVVKGGEGEGEG